jgi:hypothetical protein
MREIRKLEMVSGNSKDYSVKKITIFCGKNKIKLLAFFHLHCFLLISEI